MEQSCVTIPCLPSVSCRRLRRLAVGFAVTCLLGIVGPFVYVKLAYEKPPPPFSFDDLDRRANGNSRDVQLPTEWVVVRPASAAYVIFANAGGQRTRIEGRTTIISGTAGLRAGRFLESASFDIDLVSTVNSNPLRDIEFRAAVTENGEFPVASISLEPGNISFQARDGRARAPGLLEMHGVAAPVPFDVSSRRVGNAIELSASTLLTWELWNIRDPFAQLDVREAPRLEFNVTLVPKT